MNWPEHLTNRTWKVGDAEITEDELRGAYAAISEGRSYLKPLGAQFASERKADRAVNILKRAGLITFNRSTAQWVATETEETAS